MSRVRTDPADITGKSDGRVQGEEVYDPLRTPYEVDEVSFPVTGSQYEQFRFLVRYAVLAPSSHNSQPWKFRIESTGISVFADHSRRLPVVDPEDRELIMSIGAAIMNLRVAARHFGFEETVHYPRKNGDTPLVFVQLTNARKGTGGTSQERDFRSIPNRHTNRNPFLAARVPRSVISEIYTMQQGLESSLYISTDGTLNSEIARLIGIADRKQHADPQFRKELAEWIRLNGTRKMDGIPGAAFGMGPAAAALAPWATKALNISRVLSAKDINLCIEAPCLIIVTAEDTVSGWLEAGQLLERVLLKCTTEGLQTSYFNMAIEVPALRVELKSLIKCSDWPQLLLRVGYCLLTPGVTPRRTVEEVLA